jgi:hypothetical protein
MKKFLAWIDSFLDGRISYPEFEKNVSYFYVQDEESDRLNDEELDFVDQVYEKTTYTSPIEDLPKGDPDRRYGLIDESDFPKWLREMKEKHIALWKNN